MCGRAGSARSATVYQVLTGAKSVQCGSKYRPSYNVTPGRYLTTLVRRPVVQGTAKNGAIRDDQHEGDTSKKSCEESIGKRTELIVQVMRWGLVPWFTSEENINNTGYNTMNARAETVASKSSYRHCVDKQRCVVMMDGFFEWHKYEVLGKVHRRAYFILPAAVSKVHKVTGVSEIPVELTEKELRDVDRCEPILFLAGLWDKWTNKNTGEDLFTCTVLTTAATQEFASIHDRMPVVLRPEHIDKWLDVQSFPFSKLTHLLKPYTDNGMTWYEVSDRVNNIRNDSPENIEPLHVHKTKSVARGIGKYFSIVKPKAIHAGADPEKSTRNNTKCVLPFPDSSSKLTVSSSPPRTVMEQKNVWECNACTFLNDKPLALVCSMCASPRNEGSTVLREPSTRKRKETPKSGSGSDFTGTCRQKKKA